MRYLETKKARIEIIPMIDIMLFLLVFFAMLTLRMIPASGHLTKLPTSSTAVTIPAPKLLVEIEDDGSVTVDQHHMTPEQLTAQLRQADNSKTAVTIAGNQATSLQQVMAVIDAIKNGGVTELSLATRKVTP
ncbi:biopolymer transporter ExbD [Herbaspirillum rubrisubalbicans]|uniref:Biopolymer transporter ExbD n=1 Tax=Herbaspirillum rubrisubalbicans TaxID=80842 RepID=A0ABX9C4F6_9BURK|nr:biopolymer transporter ExbD [Herbaspirillum rubrisubalbicans]MCP1576457.1 biopolymer transport protein ExbD [Herbaspirillum rubrisubalbicans]NQE49978.1 biopolymer transporter ExbD [Herbaspirillum rubrisubalbicans]RAM65170.1 biopolymer transporter ExbD [Herbaspirillum rubrisubalbicans]RAN48802.1 biopolymer transporter ExbD [Herbaspirillum rubrisubalbicans]